MICERERELKEKEHGWVERRKHEKAVALRLNGLIMCMGGSLRFFPKIALISSDFFSVLIFTYVDKH
jgi:hypothetical protein